MSTMVYKAESRDFRLYFNSQKKDENECLFANNYLYLHTKTPLLLREGYL